LVFGSPYSSFQGQQLATLKLIRRDPITVDYSLLVIREINLEIDDVAELQIESCALNLPTHYHLHPPIPL
jgi:hypothetical protein